MILLISQFFSFILDLNTIEMTDEESKSKDEKCGRLHGRDYFSDCFKSVIEIINISHLRSTSFTNHAVKKHQI